MGRCEGVRCEREGEDESERRRSKGMGIVKGEDREGWEVCGVRRGM